MSEFQYVGFRAIDQPVSEKNLEFMRQQSSRAEITRWSFDNEYNFGDFRGNAFEMLRRGYDIQLHYANFGVRTLRIRFPQGLPDTKSFQAYEDDDALQFVKDKQGPGGFLIIEPFIESGELTDLWDLDELLERLVPLQREILDGDLRPLYLAHLAVARDGNHDPDETREGPVPAGLKKPSAAQLALAELYGLSESFMAAAALESSPLPDFADKQAQYQAWVAEQPEKLKRAGLGAGMEDPAAPVRAEVLAKYRSERSLPAWPTKESGRTLSELYVASEQIAEQLRERAAHKAARERAESLAQMAADPETTLKEVQRLVERRSGISYQQAARLLAAPREALAESKQANLAEKYALKLKNKNPTLRRLTSELRRQGFVPK